MIVALAGFGMGVAAAVVELAQVTDPDYIDEAGRIIGTADPGPKPQHPGDRGGYAQLLTLAALVTGVSFIAWRVRREITQARSGP